MQIVLTWDDREFQQALALWQEPAVRKVLGAGASAFGRAAKPILSAMTPVARPGNRYARGEGNLRRLTRYKRIRARYGIGVVVAAMGRGAYYREWVVRGTKPHVILPRASGSRGQARRALAIAGGYASVVHHPGARPNPYVERAARIAEPLGWAAAERVIFRGLETEAVQDVLDEQ